jgi:hypothetical protein
MKLSLDRQSVIGALTTLAASDAKLKVFGSIGHHYALNAPLSAEVIAAFEDRYSIDLPADYRQFITTIGNGGAGPAYGLFKFGEHDSNYTFVDWGHGYLVGDFAKPFRFNEAWNHTPEFWSHRPEIKEDTPEEEEDRLWAEWDKLAEAEYWNPSVMDGAIPICHLGCAYRQWLVVNGPQRGLVWSDDRADDRGLSPLLDSSGKQMTFSDWYLRWLEEALVAVGW